MSAKKAPAYDWATAIDGGRGMISEHGAGPDRYLEGVVATCYGYVWVYSQGFTGERRQSSAYRAILGGVEYCKGEGVARSKFGLAIMAGKFIRRLYAEVA